MTKTLKKDVIVLDVLEGLNKEKGFLYGDDIFIGEDLKIIFIRNDATRRDLLKALYKLEYHLNLLGLELKENTELSEDVVGEKLLEAFNPLLEEIEFEILKEGIELRFPKFEQTTDEITKNDGKFSNKRNASEVSEKPSLQERKKNENPYEENIVEEPKNFDYEEKKISREEKRKIANQSVLNALKQGKEKLAEISTFVNKKIEVSDTTIRNILIDLVNSGVAELAGRGIYRLIQTEKSDEKDSNDNIEKISRERKKSPQIIDDTIENNVENAINNSGHCQKQKNNNGEKMIETVVRIDEEKNVTETLISASVYPPLYRDNGAIREYLEERGVKELIIKWVLNYRSYNANRFENAPKEITDRIEEFPVYIGRGVSVLEKALASMMRDQPLSLKGEAGTGKTTLVETISSLLNLPLFSINGSLESNKATLVGEKDISDKGRLITKDGQMTKAMKWGGILYIDEINMMRPDVLAIVNAATDHRKTFFNDVSKETIIGHKDYRFVSAMNVGYAGVKKMNEATMDRTASIMLSYLGKSEIKTLLNNIALKENKKAKLDNSPELGIVDIANLTNIYLKLTSAVVTNGDIPVLAASTRNIILLAKLVPILGYELALQMMLEKFEPEEASMIVGVLSDDDLLDRLNINVANLLQEN